MNIFRHWIVQNEMYFEKSQNLIHFKGRNLYRKNFLKMFNLNQIHIFVGLSGLFYLTPEPWTHFETQWFNSSLCGFFFCGTSANLRKLLCSHWPCNKKNCWETGAFAIWTCFFFIQLMWKRLFVMHFKCRITCAALKCHL